MGEEDGIEPDSEGGVVLPDGTQLVIVGLDYENELAQVGFSVNGQLMRA